MNIFEITSRAYQRKGTSQSLKFRCTSGPRKGQVRASPAACNAPINIKKSATLKKTRAAKTNAIAVKASRTKRINPGSIRTRNLNKGRI